MRPLLTRTAVAAFATGLRNICFRNDVCPNLGSFAILILLTRTELLLIGYAFVMVPSTADPLVLPLLTIAMKLFLLSPRPILPRVRPLPTAFGPKAPRMPSTLSTHPFLPVPSVVVECPLVPPKEVPSPFPRQGIVRKTVMTTVAKSPKLLSGTRSYRITLTITQQITLLNTIKTSPFTKPTRPLRTVLLSILLTTMVVRLTMTLLWFTPILEKFEHRESRLFESVITVPESVRLTSPTPLTPTFRVPSTVGP